MRRGLIILCLWVCSAPARADDTHYHDFPLGGRAVGLGGAFVALASDPSGLYYNPAGLVDSEHHSVQIGTNLYGLEISDAFIESLDVIGDLDAFADLNIIPSSTAYTGVLDTDDDGRPITTYALGSFVPSYRTFNIDTASDGLGDNCRRFLYQRNVLDRTFLFGGGAGHRLDDTWQVGASMFLAYRSLRDREEVSCFNDRGANRSGFSTAATNLDIASSAILMSFGLKANLGHGLSVGGTITSPSIDTWNSGSIRVRRGIANTDTGTSDFFLRELDGLPANTKYGTAVRLGLGWVIPEMATMALDVDIRTPTKYELIEIPSSEAQVDQAITLSTRVRRQAVVNLNLGGEFLITPEFSLSGGFFTNFSSAPGIPGAPGETFDRDRLPNYDTYGATLVAGFFREYTLTRVGVLASYGSGADVVPRSEGLNVLGVSTDFVKVDYSQLFVYFFLSSTFRY